MNQNMQAFVPRLNENRSLALDIVLSIVTCGIWAYVMWYKIAEDLNTIGRPIDNRKSMNAILMWFLVAPITLGIAGIVWTHNIYSRTGSYLKARNIDYSCGAGTFWGWGVLGILIVVGPLVSMAKLYRALNYLSADFNRRIAE